MSAEPRPITIAILAMGGQGGGVLSEWLVKLGEANGYVAQSTYLAGVAQRTGSTVYYVELFPGDAIPEGGRGPVLSLMPVPGDVDLVVAAEAVEAGRALQRGLVSAGRTTVVASSHRVYAISEKSAMGDGTVDAGEVLADVEAAAGRLVAFDMEAAAQRCGSVISSVLFGAIAGAGVLPFPREDFEAAIRAGGKRVESNLVAFGAGFDGAANGHASGGDTTGDESQHEELQRAESAASGAPAATDVASLLNRVKVTLPEPLQEILLAGVRKLIAYQDPAYAAAYLDRVDRIVAVEGDSASADGSWRVSLEAARYLALWMSYEDTIRVADLKTRRSRFERVREEVHAREGDIVAISEFMHPRIEEVADTLPAWLGRRVLASDGLRKLTRPLFENGRQISTSSLWGFLLLYAVGRCRRFRRGTYRYKVENERIEAWLARLKDMLPQSYALALEIAQCPRLIKGYSDTHARGLASYEKIMRVLDGLPAADESAARIRELRDAALADESGSALEQALKQVA